MEALGYDEVWIAEHHFNATATSPSPFAILAHLAARTSRLRLGSAAVLLPFRDPVLVVEDVATVDILSGGRFDLGVARGGPFPEQNKHFGVGPDEARARTSEAPTLVQRLLTEDEVSFDGTFYKADGVALTPKPLQRPVPTFYATSTTDSIGLAARHGYGLMTAAPAPLARACGSVRLYREAAWGVAWRCPSPQPSSRKRGEGTGRHPQGASDRARQRAVIEAQRRQVGALCCPSPRPSPGQVPTLSSSPSEDWGARTLVEGRG